MVGTQLMVVATDFLGLELVGAFGFGFALAGCDSPFADFDDLAMMLSGVVISFRWQPENWDATNKTKAVRNRHDFLSEIRFITFPFLRSQRNKEA